MHPVRIKMMAAQLTPTQRETIARLPADRSVMFAARDSDLLPTVRVIRSLRLIEPAAPAMQGVIPYRLTAIGRQVREAATQILQESQQ